MDPFLSFLANKTKMTKTRFHQELNLDDLLPICRRLERKGRLRRLIRKSLAPELLRPYLRTKRKRLEGVLDPRVLRVYGHCKTATDVWFFLMGGVDKHHAPLEVKKETMTDGQIHFWLETSKGRRVDLTKKQMIPQLYPHHSYKNGKRGRIGSNQGAQTVVISHKRYNLSKPSWNLLQKVLKRVVDL